MFVNNALHFPCVSSSAHQRTLLFTFRIYFPLSRLSSFLLRACLCSLFQIIGSCVKLGICKAVPSLIGSSSPRSIKFGPAVGVSCLKAPWLLWYLTCLNALTFWDVYFWNVHTTVLPSWIKDQDINAPSNLEDHENDCGPHYLHSPCDAFAKWKRPSLNDRSEKHVA